MKFLNLQRWWMKKYISAAMISNASKKRTTFQLPLVSGVIGELAIVALLKSALAVFAFTNFKSSILVSSSCTEPSGMAVPAFRFTNILMSPALPCAASACATSGLGLNTIGEMRDQAFEVHGT